jgi:hypothetical protein
VPVAAGRNGAYFTYGGFRVAAGTGRPRGFSPFGGKYGVEYYKH